MASVSPFGRLAKDLTISMIYCDPGLLTLSYAAFANVNSIRLDQQDAINRCHYAPISFSLRYFD